MSCKFEYKGKQYTEQELHKVLARDPEVIKMMQNSMPQKEKNLGLDDKYGKEDLAVFEAKVKYLSKKLNAEVILDDKVENSMLLGSKDPRTIEAGRPVIVINPNKIFKTTAIHEFGHIFIDLASVGEGKKRFQEAVLELTGTELYDQIKAAYPELNEEMFNKELVTTAIGSMGAGIWENELSGNKFKQFIAWLTNKVKSMLGIEQSAVESLTRELLDNKVRTDIILESLSDQKQMEIELSKEKEDELFEDYENIAKTIDSVYTEAMARVVNVHTLTERNYKQDKKSDKKKKAFDRIDEVKKSLEKFNEVDRAKGLMEYVRWSRSYVGKLESKIISEKFNEDGEISNELLVTLSSWNSMFDILEDIDSMLEKEKQDAPQTKQKGDSVMTLGLIRRFQKEINNVVSEKNKIDTMLLDLKRDSYIKLMSKNDIKIRQKYRAKFEQMYFDRNPGVNDDDDSKEKRDFIKAMMTQYKDRIDQEIVAEYEAKAANSSSDLKAFFATFSSEKQLKSEEIQTASVLIDAKDRIIEAFGVGNASEFAANHKAYVNENGNTWKMKEKYKNLIEETENGYYLTTRYKPEFLEQYEDINSKAYDEKEAKKAYGEIKLNKKNKYLSPITGKMEELDLGHGQKIKIEGNKVLYYIPTDGVLEEQPRISVSEAIGRSEAARWKEKNTKSKKTQIGEGNTSVFHVVPNKNWESDKFKNLSKVEKETLEFLSGKIREADKDTGSVQSLLRDPFGKKNFGEVYLSENDASFKDEFIRLPSIVKSDAQMISEGDFKQLAKHKANNIYKIEKDEFDVGERDRSVKNTLKVLTDVANKEKQTVPINFRTKLDKAEQSLDLHTIILANSVQAKNYKEKKEIEAQLLVMVDVMNQRYNAKYTGAQNLKNIHASFPDKEIPVMKAKDDLPNDSRKLMSMIENRIYGIKNKDAGEVAGMNIQKLTKTWLGYSGALSLVGNVYNSAVNLSVGSVTNWMEAVAGEHYTTADLKKANMTYWKDSKDLMSDFGATVQTSRTNMFLNFWNVFGSKEYINGSFGETSRLQTLMKRDSLRPLAKAGEHMMQAKAMYAMMHNTKVFDKDNNYIDREGNVVATKKEAASIDEMITFDTVDGNVKMTLNPIVASTTFTPEGGTADEMLLDMRNKIKGVLAILHGQYDSELQAAAQREWWGKMMFFLRKWLESGLRRRYRGIGTIKTPSKEMREIDKFFSRDLKSHQEGYYITAIKFARTLGRALKTFDYRMAKAQYGKLSAHEKANMKRVASEIGMITILYLSYALAGGDDDDENLATRYVLRRTIAELSYFFDPVEAGKIVSSPTASAGTASTLLKFLRQLPKFNEDYKQGDRKGESKLRIKGEKLIPLWSSKHRDIEESLKWLNNSY